MRISDWSSDVCSSDLILAQRADLDAQIAALDRLALAQRVDDRRRLFRRDGEADADIAAGGREDLAVDADHIAAHVEHRAAGVALVDRGEIGRASCRESVCQYV